MTYTSSRPVLASLLALLSLIAAPAVRAQCVSLTTLGSASTQSFNTLSNTAGSTTNNLTITGWFMTETGSGARDNEQYAVDTGGSNTGDTFSYGAAGASDRALGSIQSGTLIATYGSCYTNNTGATITSLDIAYTGEQWRISNTAAARDDRLDFQYSLTATSLTSTTWTDVNELDFTNPIKTSGTAGALDGNSAANRTPISHSIGSLSIANGATFWIRWNDLNASGADDGLALDDFSLTPQGGGAPPTPVLNITDVTMAEGDPPGTTTFTFAVTITAPAGAGGVTFDIATADNTALNGSDYVAQSLTGQSIAVGSSGPYNFSVTVNRDTTTEPNETFFVNVTNITGANAGDVQGLGTINNDDVTVTPIHDVQGPGATSPIVGASVTVRGIVTGIKSNGFFVQEEDAEVDADPATSEGIYVFTSSAVPGTVVMNAQVQVTGTVVEYVPSADVLQPPLTELTSPTIAVLANGQPLPAPVPLTASFPSPAGPHDQLERLEGMRVSVASMTVVGPSDGSINEPNATGASNGRFHAVVTGVPRPFREPGIQAPDPAPSGASIPPVPRWDANPERLRIESASINGQPSLALKTGDVVTPIVGPLDYGFRAYTIYPDGTSAIAVTPSTLPTTISAPASDEFTVASFNLQRFFDTANDPAIGEPVLTTAGFNRRLAKVSIAVRNHLNFPDVVGVQEVENLATLQAIAAQISADAVANTQPDPMYVAYLSEGNDVGGIDIGFLVKTAEVATGLPRVDVASVTQVGLTAMWTDPSNGASDELNDRPPLVLEATINRAPGASFDVVVINNHLRSLLDISDESASGATTVGNRVRVKRLRQAEYLANYIQGRQTADPTEALVVVGDMNAFEFNDGYVHSLGVITGQPAPDNETAVAGDGADIVNPDLINLVNTPPAAERYSYVEDGSAQNIDHVLVNAALVASTTARRIEHARISSDYPESERSSDTTALRLTDHDPTVAYIQAPSLSGSDLAITVTDSPDPVVAGTGLTYTVTVTNNGPDAATGAEWTATLPTGTGYTSLSSPPGWSCTTPAVGAGGTVTCSNAAMAVGASAFTLVAAVDPAVAAGTVLTTTATASTTGNDSVAGNDSAMATTTVSAAADVGVTVTDSPDPVTAGTALTYTLTLTNAGPSHAAAASLSDTLPFGTTFSSLTAPGGWSCTTPVVGASGAIDCSIASMAPGSATFTLVVSVDPSIASGTVLSNTALATTTTTDANALNDDASATTTVAASADLSITNTDVPDPVNGGQTIAYTIAVANAGPSVATALVMTDALPAATTFQSLASPAGWSCTTPAVGASGVVTCTAAVLDMTPATFTLTVATGAALPSGTVISNTATIASATPDPATGNEAAIATTTLGSGSADLSTAITDSPDPVVPGTSLSYSITVANAGPSTASSVTLTDTLPAGTTFASLTAPGGWSCTTPVVGAGGTVSCSIASMAVGNAAFTLVVAIDPSVAPGTTLSNTATAASSTSDPTSGNESATATTLVGAGSADLSVTMTDAPDPVGPGGTLTYTITAANAGPSNATTATLTDVLPAGTTFASLTSPAGWSCTTPAVGATGTVTCSNASMAIGSGSFTLAVSVDAGTAAGTTLSNTATIASATSDPATGSESATATTTVGSGSADLSVTMTDAPDPVAAGGTLTYTITATNSGPSNAAAFTLTDALPSGTTFASLTSPAGYACSTPAVGAAGTVTCSHPSMPAGTATFALSVNVAESAGGTTLSNTATVASSTPDPTSGDASATATTAVSGAPIVGGTMTVAGTGAPGSTVTYTVVLTNSGNAAQTDNPGAEFTDLLPASLTLVSATANSGTATANVGTNTVTWNGAIPAGGTVTITITATVRNPAPGTSIVNQGQISYDANGDGTNDTTVMTDNPGTGAAGDGTGLIVPGASVPAVIVPTTSLPVELLLIVLMALVAGAASRRRSA